LSLSAGNDECLSIVFILTVQRKQSHLVVICAIYTGVPYLSFFLFPEISHPFTATSKCSIALSLEVSSQHVQMKYITDFQTFVTENSSSLPKPPPLDDDNSFSLLLTRQHVTKSL
jgi:hypothetical protein